MGEHETGDEKAHLGDVPDGSGCTEIWERLSEQRGEGTPDEDEE